MKLQCFSVAVAAATILCTFGTKQIRAEESNTAACCSDFDAECYTESNNRTNGHSCNSCAEPACSAECTADATSEACKACCVTYPQHEVSWECPAQSITCVRDEYGIGNYTDEYLQKPIACPNGQGDASFKFNLVDTTTVEDCLSLCESTGIPGCCQYQETVDTEQNTTSIRNCRFISSDGDTFAELQNANGTEPVRIYFRRLLMSSGTYHRATRCEKNPAVGTDAPGTDSPSTDEPTTPGSDGAATETSVSIAVVFAAVAVLQAL